MPFSTRGSCAAHPRLARTNLHSPGLVAREPFVHEARPRVDDWLASTSRVSNTGAAQPVGGAGGSEPREIPARVSTQASRLSPVPDMTPSMCSRAPWRAASTPRRRVTPGRCAPWWPATPTRAPAHPALRRARARVRADTGFRPITGAPVTSIPARSGASA